MSRNRRIAALEVLQRIKQQELDGIGARLSDIRTEQSWINEQLVSLSQRASQEVEAATTETLPFLSDFLQATELRRKALTLRLEDLAKAAQDIEEELKSAFIDSKKNEVVLDIARTKDQLAEQRRETAETAEVAQNIYLRHRQR
ncbi:hypothetical protein NBRC116590_24630 [Pelagimonas sp. KU-00592-HH]|uniref:hypothetical protein n=1 Tax=Pelagimonas sp. KU-00592-HH TaxID=3127651 RepID=UPI0031055C84